MDLLTIAPLDSEENHSYKCIGRESMRAAIYHRKITPEQYSRPQLSTISNGINCKLVFGYQ